MKEVPEYEKYPVSQGEMGKRYKNWTNGLAHQMMVLYRVGKETGGEKFIERLKEEYFRIGRQSALSSMRATGTTKEDFKDCSSLSKICDLIDDSMANFWDGYVENTAGALEKEIKTCPVVKSWSKEPEICDVLLGEFVKGVAYELNPQFKTDGFSKLLVKGDNCCRYRIEL
ncbi:MAG: hypothetical protein M0P57_10840 [Syntrophales bacterium]|jgi:hypothetical protein|nr:hypothetical protein [Syntrophales bacterium]MDY0043085.1 hypothetical protein [Syntrophales bacterium]